MKFAATLLFAAFLSSDVHAESKTTTIGQCKIHTDDPDNGRIRGIITLEQPDLDDLEQDVHKIRYYTKVDNTENDTYYFSIMPGILQSGYDTLPAWCMATPGDFLSINNPLNSENAKEANEYQALYAGRRESMIGMCVQINQGLGFHEPRGACMIEAVEDENITNFLG